MLLMIVHGGSEERTFTMGKKAMALFTAAAMLLTGVSCAKKGGSPDLSDKEKVTGTQEITTAVTEEETKEMATEHISPVETVSAIIGSQMTDGRTIGRAQGSNTAKFPLADLMDEGDKILSFTFVVYSGDDVSNIGEFKGGCGISVEDKCPSATHPGWFQSEEFTAPTQGTYGEITWIVPEDLRDYIHESGEVMFGYWWGGCSSLRIENVICTVERTREVPVDGEVSVDPGAAVSYSEGDRTVRIPLGVMPGGMVPEVVTFSIRSIYYSLYLKGISRFCDNTMKISTLSTRVLMKDFQIEESPAVTNRRAPDPRIFRVSPLQGPAEKDVSAPLSCRRLYRTAAWSLRCCVSPS